VRIAFTIDRLDPRKGGAEAYVDRLGRWLVDRGHDVVLVVRDAELPADAPLRVERVDAPGWPRGRAERAFARLAAERATAAGADAVLAVRHAAGCTVYQPHGGLHADTLGAMLESREAGSLGRLAARLSGRHRVFLDLERRLLGGDDPPTFVALSRRVERSALARYPGLEGRTRVVPNGVDLERFHPRLREEARASVRSDLGIGERPLFLLLAHNPRLKGVVPALRALAAAGGLPREAHLAVIGRGADRFAGLAARLGVAGRTTFRRPVDDAPRWLAAAAALVHPTFHDPCSLVALEALACGTPVITTARNGVAEILEDEPEAGAILDDPRDRDALVASLERFADRDAARVAGERARVLAERHPWDRGFATMEELLLGGALPSDDPGG
jgi:UDP-glucose:(heptosyl)LPS alpha-1,3-glucosyltransferase